MEPSEGARRAALIMAGGDADRKVYIYGGLDTTGMFPNSNGWASVPELAAIIDRETHSAEMRKALEALLACQEIDYHGSGTRNKSDDCEVCMAVDKARAALKGGAL